MRRGDHPPHPGQAPLVPKSQPPQPPTTESQIPSGMTPEVVIRRPMVTQPPIEALDFYQSMTTHHVRDPTVIHFTIDGHHGILGARHIVEALRIPYDPARPEDYRVWAHPSIVTWSIYCPEGHPHAPIFEEGAPSQHVLYRCTPAP
ncbi:hypothetical protein CK203_108121 [Vitis vinifera]|uniref:Uncharacterized protein n=1 Tax=Vitis vinifera TaxID=29760 RepID=A0A438DK34_VITVI|nr:hypothetical protein CK203_108121 [Vitis vinifera]